MELKKNTVRSGIAKSGSYEISESGEGTFVLRFEGKMYVENASRILKALKAEIKFLAGKNRVDLLSIDLSNLLYIDDFGALVISGIRRIPGLKKTKVEISKASDGILSVMHSFDRKKNALRQNTSSGVAKPESIIERTGERFLSLFATSKDMASFLGEVVISFFYSCRHLKSFRFRDMTSCMEKTGVNALPVIALSNFLLGFIIAFMSSLQLRQFGANLYVASLVALAMVSELGPVMTAIIVAGRTGSAFAAEIGTMKISEEIDALFTMGFNPVLFLAAPRIIASVIVVPVLTLFANLFAITGGLVIGVTMLNLTPGSYINQTIEALGMSDFFWCVLKSFVFAIIISLTGCFRGFRTEGSAEAVGAAATSTVVACIVFIILFDSVFAIIRYYWT